MKTYYKNNLKEALLILESDSMEMEDYQCNMLKENQIPGVLKTSFRYVNGMTQYCYDISGKIALSMLYEKTKLCLSDIRGLTESLLQTIKELQKYMLPAENLLLEPEHIFCEKGNYYFCFYPAGQEELKDRFHKLTEFFVREVDYKDEEGVRLAYTLHKSTMEDNCTIEQILAEFEQSEPEEKIIAYSDRMEKPDIETIMIAEKIEFWEPIRKLLEKRKRPCK